jgi:hypothetical protein
VRLTWLTDDSSQPCPCPGVAKKMELTVLRNRVQPRLCLLIAQCKKERISQAACMFQQPEVTWARGDPEVFMWMHNDDSLELSIILARRHPSLPSPSPILTSAVATYLRCVQVHHLHVHRNISMQENPRTDAASREKHMCEVAGKLTVRKKVAIVDASARSSGNFSWGIVFLAVNASSLLRRSRKLAIFAASARMTFDYTSVPSYYKKMMLM